jgi:hypothetical protein
MSAFLRELPVLLPVGAAVGLVGSLIGVGGGFFVVPFLLHLWGGFDKTSATAASLGIVLLNALSATGANLRRGRVDLRTGGLLAAATLPGAVFGRHAIGAISSRAFSISFAVLLLAVAAYVALVRLRPGKGLLRGKPRELRDGEGGEHRYEVNAPAGVLVSLGTGVVSSLFGVGGGLILVPFLVLAYGAPVIVSTATAQFAFVFTSALGLAEALRRGQMTEPGWRVLGAMGAGVVVGAQLGVALARRVQARLIRWLLAAVLAGVAAVMVLNALDSGPRGG